MAALSAAGIDRLSGLTFHLIAHTHWDREWYLTRAAFGARLVPTLDDLLQRLAADPAYRSFLLDGQTVLARDYLALRPDRERTLAALAREGRLELGPWYVLADELIPSGEALLRNLLLGAADLERWGARAGALYSPDAFGHPAALPTLARQFGFTRAALWRGYGGRAGEERDLFRWRAPSGAELLVWHFPPAGYEIGAALPADPATLSALWTEVRRALVARAASPHVPVFVGADHHAAHPDLPRLRDLIVALEPRESVRISRLDEFLEAAGQTPGLRTVSGELRWSYGHTWTLQGVHGTRASQKRANSALELFLEREAEPLAALARRYGGRDRRPLLEAAWRTLVETQFHDTLAGTTSDAVARDLRARQEAVAAIAGEVARGSLYDLVRHDPDAARAEGAGLTPALVLWNAAARPRGGVTIADLTFFRRDVPVGPPAGRRPSRDGAGFRPFALHTADGRALPVQVLDRRIAIERLEAARHYPDQDEVDVVRVAFRAPSVSGLGLATLAPRNGEGGVAGGESALVRGRSLVNRLVEVQVQSSGALTVTDRATGERYPDLLRLEDEDDVGDAYTYCPAPRQRIRVAQGPVKVRRLAAGPLVAALEVRTRLPGVPVRLVVTLHADSPLVRCVVEVDNRRTNHRARLRAPTGLAGVAATAGAPFGTMVRPAVTFDPAHFPAETPARTAPAHRFVAVARGGRGLALFAPGFFEYELTPGGDVLVTALRAVGELSKGNLATRPGHAAWATPIPEAQEPGRHLIALALAPCGETALARGDDLPRAWEDAFLPVRGVWLRDARRLDPAPVDVVLEGTGLVLSAVKPAQAGSPMVLRCYNATDRRVAGAWRFGDGVKTAHRVRGDEREAVALVIENRGKTVRFTAEPHDLVTILVT